ncbi:hypothetical protein HD554DRAFT_2029403, partial [Boletus coccyginus]
LPQVLVDFGLFPVLSSQPQLAVSLDLLGFYQVLFEHSCNAINALTAVLCTHYTYCGFLLVNKKVLDSLLYNVVYLSFTGRCLAESILSQLGCCSAIV